MPSKVSAPRTRGGCPILGSIHPSLDQESSPDPLEPCSTCISSLLMTRVLPGKGTDSLWPSHSPEFSVSKPAFPMDCEPPKQDLLGLTHLSPRSLQRAWHTADGLGDHMKSVLWQSRMIRIGLSQFFSKCGVVSQRSWEDVNSL